MHQAGNTLFTTIFAVILMLFTVGLIQTAVYNPNLQSATTRQPTSTALPQEFIETADISTGTSELSTEPTTVVLGESENALTPQELLAEPEAYLAKTVTVQGELAEVIDNRTFRLSTESSTDLIVLTPQPFLDEKQSVYFSDNDEVSVTGTFLRFTKDVIEPDYDLRILDTVYAEFTDEYAIVVDSVGKRVDYTVE